MTLYRLSGQESTDGDSHHPARHNNAVVLDYFEIRRQCLIQELRYVEQELITGGRIKRVTVAPPRLR